jgi:hypothetical protein
MAVAQIGPLTTVLEGYATAVAAGVVLGSVGVGGLGLVLGWSRRSIGDRAITDGYAGGMVGAAIALIDICLRYCL